MAKTCRGLIVPSLLLTVFFISGCGTTEQPQRGAVNTTPRVEDAVPQTNVEELGVLVNIPYEAEDVVWKEQPKGRITAVFLFSPAMAKRVIEEALMLGASSSVRIPVESWYPSELVAQGEMSGDSAVQGNSYRADKFFQAPFTTGRIVKLEGTDHFVLELEAK